MLQRQLCQLVAARGLATGVATTPRAQTSPAVSHNPVYFNNYDVKVTRLPTGVVVATVDTKRDVSHIGLTFNCGTRNEGDTNLGITQRISNAIGLGTENLPLAEIGKLQASLGCQFKSTYTREHVLISLNCPRDQLSLGVEFLGELGQPSFQSWSLSDRRVDLDLEAQEGIAVPANRLMDLVHRAAYGTGGLGNQLVQPANIVKSHDRVSHVVNFAKQYMGSGNAALTGLGVDHETLLRYAADHLNLHEAPAKGAEAASYRGGEVRNQATLNHTYCSIVTEGANVKDLKGMAVQAVMSTLLVGVPGSDLHSTLSYNLLSKALNMAAPNSDAQAGAVNLSYSDSGLFGIQFSCAPNVVEKVGRACLLEFRNMASTGVTKEQFDAAKDHLLMYIQVAEDNSAQLLSSMSSQVATNGAYSTPHEVLKAIAGVTAADVQQHASTLMKKKLAMAALGNLENTPYLQELTVA